MKGSVHSQTGCKQFLITEILINSQRSDDMPNFMEEYKRIGVEAKEYGFNKGDRISIFCP